MTRKKKQPRAIFRRGRWWTPESWAIHQERERKQRERQEREANQ